KLAPPRFVGLAMGGWFLSLAVGGDFSGLVARSISGEHGMTVASALSGFNLCFWTLLGSGVVLLLISPLVNRLMPGVKYTLKGERGGALSAFAVCRSRFRAAHAGQSFQQLVEDARQPLTLVLVQFRQHFPFPGASHRSDVVVDEPAGLGEVEHGAAFVVAM